MNKRIKKKKTQNTSIKAKNIKKKSAIHKKNNANKKYYPNGNKPGNKRPNHNNPRKNSYSKKYKLDEKYEIFAKNIAKKLHIKYAGIDLLHPGELPLPH